MLGRSQLPYVACGGAGCCGLAGAVGAWYRGVIAWRLVDGGVMGSEGPEG
jgi:hypothetical protein